MKNFTSQKACKQARHVNWKKVYLNIDIFVNEVLWLLCCFCNAVAMFENKHTHTHTNADFNFNERPYKYECTLPS